MNAELDRETYKFLCELYAEYLRRRKSGQSRQDALSFSPGNVRLENQDALDNYLSELCELGFVEDLDLSGDFVLNGKAIAYMEGRFKRGLSEVIDTISKLKP